MTSMIGCTVQCPFCGEQCDMLHPSHCEDTGQKHQTAVHRMDGLSGWRDNKSEALGTYFCPVEVASNRSFKRDHIIAFHPYKKVVSRVVLKIILSCRKIYHLYAQLIQVH